MRHDLAGNRSFRIVVAKDGDFDFTSDDAFLDQNLHREFRGEIQSWRQLLARMHLGHAYRGAERGRFDEQGIVEFSLEGLLNFPGITLPIGTLRSNPGHNRNLGNLQQALGDILVHADG